MVAITGPSAECARRGGAGERGSITDLTIDVGVSPRPGSLGPRREMAGELRKPPPRTVAPAPSSTRCGSWMAPRPQGCPQERVADCEARRWLTRHSIRNNVPTYEMTYARR